MMPANASFERNTSVISTSVLYQNSYYHIMSNRIALILGSGAGLGSHVASRLHSEGYRVATVSRSLKDAENNGETALALECDLADPTGVETVFEKVRGAWGEPSVVVYNGMIPDTSIGRLRHLYNCIDFEPTAYAVTSGKTSETALDLSTAEFQQHLAVNTTSAFVAAREALSGFKKLGHGNFFYTGNMLVWNPIPRLLTLGLGKTASAHFIQAADSVWREKGIRYVFVATA
jgi:NAD(P)-dependent dehydrogenase (short-subunit alcohol dehydrogenase family)